MLKIIFISAILCITSTLSWGQTKKIFHKSHSGDPQQVNKNNNQNYGIVVKTPRKDDTTKVNVKDEIKNDGKNKSNTKHSPVKKRNKDVKKSPPKKPKK